MREVAVGIAGNLVERENQSFFEYLDSVWKSEHPDEVEDDSEEE